MTLRDLVQYTYICIELYYMLLLLERATIADLRQIRFKPVILRINRPIIIIIII